MGEGVFVLALETDDIDHRARAAGNGLGNIFYQLMGISNTHRAAHAGIVEQAAHRLSGLTHHFLDLATALARDAVHQRIGAIGRWGRGTPATADRPTRFAWHWTSRACGRRGRRRFCLVSAAARLVDDHEGGGTAMDLGKVVSSRDDETRAPERMIEP
nr:MULTISPECIES: hypothetical protein [unclassified Novosphingobium]